MGRNFHSVCHECKEQLMHLRGQENINIQRFADDHYNHKDMTEVVDDYVTEPPDSYKEVFDDYNPEWESKMVELAKRRTNGD